MSTDYQSPVKLGYEEFVLFPNDGNRHEIIDGKHYMNPPPSTGHQSASKHLQYQLYQKICLLYTSPSPRDRTRSRMPSSA